LTDLAGLPRPSGLVGRSLVPLLEDAEAPWPHPAYTVMSLGDKKGGELARSVVSENYRYTEWGSRNQAELYNLEQDPGEQRNLAADPAHREARAQMADLAVVMAGAGPGRFRFPNRWRWRG
jgi:iduronate 2-sulfatase